jgi:DHA1 family bicyclomycin/chloramphenicol resistance-like MFS transporter
MLATSIEWLIVTRAVQGAAMGAAVMCARAIIRDLYAPAEGRACHGAVVGGLGVIACLSPLYRRAAGAAGGLALVAGDAGRVWPGGAGAADAAL